MSSKLKDYAKLDNISPELDEEKLRLIGNQVLRGFEEDLDSSSEWLEDVKKVEELVSLVSKKKTKPLPSSANIKYPLITKACYEFSSRTYPEIIRDGKVVKGQVIGKDLEGKKFEQAERVCAFMNYQLLSADSEWELELDRLLNQLALVGFICKKTYYDPIREKIKSEICEYKDLIINSSVTSLEDAPRISHVLRVRLNHLIEGARCDVYNQKPISELELRFKDSDKDEEICLIEQHTFCDLDEDGYKEPYIVTILKDSGEVLRIAPRFTAKMIKMKNDKVKYIDAIHYFTDYHFLVSPKGKFQSVGFGILMLHLNEAINTMMNQLTDAGQLCNMQTGYIDARLKAVEGDGVDLMPGEWQRMKSVGGMALKDGVFPITYKEPSNVLFQMLGLLIESAKELSSSTEAMTGGGSPENVKSGAVMAMIDQSLKLFTSIQNRVYRSLAKEYRKVFRLNALYLDPEQYINIVDDQLAVLQDDFNEAKVDIIPIADPNLSSEAQRIARYQILLQLINLPGLKPDVISKRLIQALNLPNTDEMFVSDEDKKNAPPPFDVIKLQSEMEGHAQELKLKERQVDQKDKELALQVAEMQLRALEIKTKAILNIATAESLEAGNQLEQYKTQADMILAGIDRVQSERQMEHDQRMQSEAQAHEQQMQASEQAHQQQIEALKPDGQAPA